MNWHRRSLALRGGQGPAAKDAITRPSRFSLTVGSAHARATEPSTMEPIMPPPSPATTHTAITAQNDGMTAVKKVPIPTTINAMAMSRRRDGPSTKGVSTTAITKAPANETDPSCPASPSDTSKSFAISVTNGDMLLMCGMLNVAISINNGNVNRLEVAGLVIGTQLLDAARSLPVGRRLSQ
jgi:hypothetical protein